ncbi:MAG: type II secretion system F family protein [Steroidobacteraceae bacterium]
MNGDTLLIGLLAAVSVMSAAVLAFRVTRPVRSATRGAQRAMPRLLRCLWPLVRVVAYYLGPRLSVRWRQRTLRQIQGCELDHLFLPHEWLATRLLGALLGASVSALAASHMGAGVFWVSVCGSVALWWYTGQWLSRRRGALQRRVIRDLPVYLDVLTLAVEAGASLTVALGWCIDKNNDSPLHRGLTRVLREVRAGRTRIEALRAFEHRLDMPAVTSLVTALVNAEQTGASVGQVLRAQAAQRNAERFARAEKLAMEAPVKMLGPLVLCIFPCTFIVLGFPVAMQLSRQFSE